MNFWVLPAGFFGLLGCLGFATLATHHWINGVSEAILVWPALVLYEIAALRSFMISADGPPFLNQLGIAVVYGIPTVISLILWSRNRA